MSCRTRIDLSPQGIYTISVLQCPNNMYHLCRDNLHHTGCSVMFLQQIYTVCVGWFSLCTLFPRRKLYGCISIFPYFFRCTRLNRNYVTVFKPINHRTIFQHLYTFIQHTIEGNNYTKLCLGLCTNFLYQHHT